MFAAWFVVAGSGAAAAAAAALVAAVVVAGLVAALLLAALIDVLQVRDVKLVFDTELYLGPC